MNYQNDQNLMLLTYSDTKRTLMHLFLFTNSAQRELQFQYLPRVYATQAINFPCIITLGRPTMGVCEKSSSLGQYQRKEGIHRCHEPSLCRHEPPRFTMKSELLPCSKSLPYTVNLLLLFRIFSFKLLVLTCSKVFFLK